MPQQRTGSLGIRIARFGACLALSLACAAALPKAAFALYSDVTPEYPASQELVVPGDVVYAADIPNGTYAVPAVTTSYMCILSNPTTGARNSCTITVNDGTIIASFNISAAYTALYMGTAEAAAASTNDEGTDASAYILGDPVDGYVPHYYQIVVPALNYPFDVATYNGGTKGFEAGMWYTRQFAIHATDEIYEAIAEAQRQQQNENQQQEDSTPASEEPPQPDPTESVSPGSAAIGADAQGSSAGVNTQAVTHSSGSSTEDGSGNGDGNGSGEGDGDGTGTGYESEGSLMGTLMTITGMGNQLEGESLEEGDIEEEDKELSTQAALGLGAGILLAAGVLWRTIGFKRGLKQ